METTTQIIPEALFVGKDRIINDDMRFIEIGIKRKYSVLETPTVHPKLLVVVDYSITGTSSGMPVQSAKEIAAEVTKRINMHDQLVEALKEVCKQYQSYRDSDSLQMPSKAITKAQEILKQAGQI